jgi:hypothetical protein
LPFVRSRRIFHFSCFEDESVLIAELLAAAVSLWIVIAMARRGVRRRSTRHSAELGSVSQRWLAVHRTEN